MAAGSQDRKKVLVVDDSEMVRQVMKGLLQKEYKVSVAKSGIAAIRAMTLERPDLILLDYNMPVCDGALLLQMIRSEEDFADISVIFLTATIDKASVKRVVPLKPEGYLLKSMKPIEIKKRIDGFFARKEGSR
jgi:CheY-like chemotaxis protein